MTTSNPCIFLYSLFSQDINENIRLSITWVAVFDQFSSPIGPHPLYSRLSGKQS